MLKIENLHVEVDGKEIKIKVRVSQHDKMRTIFGETKKHVDIRTQGKLKKPGKIVGSSNPADNQDFEVKVRLSRLQKLD